MRVWLPVSIDDLRRLHALGELAGPLEGFAVTDEVRAEFADLSEEELEYAVTEAAAESAVALWPGGRQSGRRVVLVADTLGATPVESAAGAVVCGEPIRVQRVDAVLLDPEDVRRDVDNATGLAWYATQEIPNLLAQFD